MTVFTRMEVRPPQQKGIPGLRLIPETVPCECSIMEDAEEGISQVIDQIIDALTKPLTA